VYRPITTNRFLKDQKRMVKRGKKFDKLDLVMEQLIQGLPLDPSLRDHKLEGDWSGSRECHVEPNWLLIYRIDGELIIFERTGTHPDLFGG